MGLEIDISENLKFGLQKFDMLHDKSGLRFVSDVRNELNSIESFTERFELEQADRVNADAVYFRRFENRPSKPQAYIYDSTTRDFDELEFGEIHKNIWSRGVVPLVFVFTEKDIKIFNCTKHAVNTNKGLLPNYLEKSLKISAEYKSLSNYSAYQFDSGLFWEQQEYNEEFKYSNSAYDKLVNGLREVRKKFIKRSNLDKHIAHRLLVQSILIKYLEERRDNDGKKVFPNEYFKKYNGAENFCDILRTRGTCLELFDDLSNHFNGKIFQWEDSKDRKILKNKDLNHLADFLDAKKETSGQLVLWRLYSFNHLPIELISSIYEEFLGDKSTGAVYTPPHLVSFLIDKSMPIDSPPNKDKYKILDPACGSGIFLVAAFKRLVQWWRVKKYRETEEIESPDLDTLKNLITSNLYGVDISKEAVQLTVFSLSLALCDLLTPTEIWYELKFEDLVDENVFGEDFFEFISKDISQDFDLVIGNPPFIEKYTSKTAKKRAVQRNANTKIPQNQLALLFLEESHSLLSDNGSLCLIMPSAPLLYNIKAFEYRKHLFSSYPVKQVIDFTPLHSVLWSGVNVSAAALFMDKNSTRENILHLTVRRTKQAKEKLHFEVDEYDFHEVQVDEILKNKYIWKVNLLGGGKRLTYLINKLQNFRSLKDYLDEKELDGWVVGEGYIKGAVENKSKKEIKEKYKEADYITGKPSIPTESLTEDGIIEEDIFSETSKYFIRPRNKNKKIYHPPHILVKEKIGENNFPVDYCEKYLTFKHQIIGIHAPESEEEDLKKVYKAIKEFGKLYKFYIYSTSGVSGVSKSTAILKNDVLRIPYSDDFEELTLSDSEKIVIDDALDYMIDFIQRGENAKVLKSSNTAIVKNYGKILSNTLNSIYGNNKSKFNISEIIDTGQYIVTTFKYGTKHSTIDVTEASGINSLINDIIPLKYLSRLFVLRSLRLYSENSIIIVKPNQIRYWLKSIALKDADKIFSEFVDSGY